MDSAKWKIVKETFSAVTELPLESRENFWKDFDPEIKSEVENLLAAHEKADDFIAESVFVNYGLAGEKVEVDFTDKYIGNYKIIERIGAGGMGAIYLAERVNSDFKQKVALKLIKRGMDSEAILKRFATERRILSQLKHPNIAQLFDGGISNEGLPFFVMEYVEGAALNQFCRENDLSLEERLKIFRRICAAVEHAHQNLIVHRDLKPSNIIVTKDGTPKLLDFGIAKLLSDEDAEITVTQGNIFTPEYASPEQITGKTVTTATDVYSLGVILYELLSGHRPFNTKGKSYAEIIKSVCETEPVAPSRALYTGTNEHSKSFVTAENNGQNTQNEKVKLNPKSKIQNLKSLKGDLDNIVLKALRKESAERYGTVQQFSEDILRFLKDLPISARPQTFKYRFEKYVKRHRAGVFAAALILLSLVGGISVAAWQAVIAGRERAKAERRFSEVRKLANTILFDHYEQIKSLPGATAARAKLVSDALVYLDGLAQESSDNPELQRELVTAYQKLAEIQGDVVNGSNLGDENAARTNFLKAINIQEILAASDVAIFEDQRNLGLLYLKVSVLFNKADEHSLEEDYTEKGLQIFQFLRNKNPNPVQAQADLARALWFQANIIRLNGDKRRSIETYLQAAEIYENLVKENANPPLYKRNAALTYKNIGTIYSLEKDFSKSLEFYQKALILDEENAARLPDDVSTKLDLSFSRRSLAEIFFRLDEKDKAVREYETAIAIQENVVAVDAKNYFAKISLFNSYLGIAELYRDSQKYDKAQLFYQKSKQLVDSSTTPDNTDEQTYTANFFFSYGIFYMRKADAVISKMENTASARQNLLKAKELYADLKKRNVLDPAFEENVKQTDEFLEKLSQK